jgi:hypothetical protein
MKRKPATGRGSTTGRNRRLRPEQIESDSKKFVKFCRFDIGEQTVDAEYRTNQEVTSS